MKGVGRAQPPYNYTVLPGNEPSLLFECFSRRPWWRETPDGVNFNFWWGGNGQHFKWEWLARDGTRQLVNKLEGHKIICTKTKLATTLRAYAASSGVALGSIIPDTYLLSAGSRSADSAAFDAAARALAASGAPPGAQWIVKPGGLNRGRGICVFNDAPGVMAHLSGAERGSEWVVQRYITDPMLVRGRKFDIRQLVLLAPGGACYMFRDSYVRTCSAEFRSDDTDLAVHLTNDAVQKELDCYGKFEDANKLSFEEFEQVLREAARAGSPAVTLDGHIWPAMRQAVAHVVRAAGRALNPAGRECSFELLGFDFMLESTGRLRLLEVNTSPALFRHGRVLTRLFPLLMEELFQKVVDPAFPPPPGHPAPEQLSRFERVDLTPGALRGGAPPPAARRASEPAAPAAARRASNAAVGGAGAGAARAAAAITAVATRAAGAKEAAAAPAARASLVRKPSLLAAKPLASKSLAGVGRKSVTEALQQPAAAAEEHGKYSDGEPEETAATREVPAEQDRGGRTGMP